MFGLLKKTLKSNKMNPIDSGPAKINSIGLGACSKTFQEMLEALKERNKMLQKFVEQNQKYLFTSYTTKYRHRNMPQAIFVLKEDI